MHPHARVAIEWIVVYVLCLAGFVGAWYASATPDTTLPLDGTGLFGVLAAWVGVQAARAAVTRWRERAAVASASRFGPLRDGDLVVARGTLHAESPLITPFSGVPAVAYEYKAYRRERRRSDRVDLYRVDHHWGDASVPCALVTPQGAIPVRSRLRLDLPYQPIDNTPGVRANFEAFRRRAQPVVTSSSFLVVHPGFPWDAALDDVLRRDGTRDEPAPPLADLSLEERMVALDEPVVLVGRISDARGGLVHDDRRGRPLRVLKGDAEDVRAELRTSALTFTILSGLAFAVALVLAGSALGWHELGF